MKVRNMPNKNITYKKVQNLSKLLVKELFGQNVLLMTNFCFFEIDKDETSVEYYISARCTHFDLWYDPDKDDVAFHLLLGLCDLYHRLTDIPGDYRETARKLHNDLMKIGSKL